GRFSLRLADDFATWFADRVVTVQASAPGLGTVSVPVRFGSRPQSASVELRLEAAAPLRGRLLDQAGRPAAGVRVEVVRGGEAGGEPRAPAGLAGPGPERSGRHLLSARHRRRPERLGPGDRPAVRA